MRQRIDLSSAIVAIGAIGLLISLFLDWFASATAWDSFELVDWLLAACAVAALAGAGIAFANGAALPRWARAAILAALALVVSQLIDAPPGFENDAERGEGGWIALASTLLMGSALALAAASVSVIVDVRGRERRRRVPAADRRQGAAAAAPPPREEPPAPPPPPAPQGDPQRTQPLRPVEPRGPGGDEPAP